MNAKHQLVPILRITSYKKVRVLEKGYSRSMDLQLKGGEAIQNLTIVFVSHESHCSSDQINVRYRHKIKLNVYQIKTL